MEDNRMVEQAKEAFNRLQNEQLKKVFYRNNQAIEYAMQKCDMGWSDNRIRLNFYDYFNEYYNSHNV